MKLSHLFENINKIGKPLGRLNKNKRGKIEITILGEKEGKWPLMVQK